MPLLKKCTAFAHLNTGHGGREKMLKEVNKKYANVTRDVLNLFKEMCEDCQLKEKNCK